MSNMEKNIKNYSPYLWIFIIVNLTVYICVTSGNLNLNFVSGTYKSLTIKNGIIASASAVITFLLNGLLTSNFKATLVFWRLKNVYPGCRIFTEIINKDCRIDKSALIRKYGELPVEPNAQNKLWYKIFKNNEFDPMIFNSHRNFLISRDLTGLSFLFSIIYTVASLISRFLLDNAFKLLIPYIIFLITQYILFSIVSQHYGNRFACNVLALESSKIG